MVRTTVGPNFALKHLREQKCWSQRQLADAVGTTVINVSRWERGITSPGMYFRQRLCESLDASPEALGFVTAALPPPPAPSGHVEETAQAPLSLASGRPLRYALPALPPRPSTFVGRAELMARLKRCLIEDRGPACIALHGLPAIGKTALAVELAHDPDLLGHFSDGVVWVGLGPQPNVLGLLSSWGAMLQLPSAGVSELQNMEGWASALAGAIGDRHMLVIIDDIWRLEDALAFQVGGTNTSYLMTSRFPLLACQLAGSGAIAVQELTEDDSVMLLEALAPGVVAAEPEAVHDLVRSVGGLPLALLLFGRYLHIQAYSRQSRRIRVAFARLGRVEERLALAEPHAPGTRHSSLPKDVPLSLRAVIKLSEDKLGPPARQTLRALSLFPPKPSSFSEEAALQIQQTSTAALDELCDAGLLETIAPDRYALHQVIADYARLWPRDRSSDARVVAYFVTFVEAHADDYRTLDLEATNIAAMFEMAVEGALHSELTRGVIGYAPYFLARGLYDVGTRYLEWAEHAASILGDQAALAHILLYRGRIAELRGELWQAEATYERGLALARLAGLGQLTCAFLAFRAETAIGCGSHLRAEPYIREGIALGRTLRDRRHYALLLRLLGEVYDCAGRSTLGDRCYHKAYAVALDVGDQECCCALLQNLAEKALARGAFDEAERYIERGLTVARTIGHRQRISALLTTSGMLLSKQGRPRVALPVLEEAHTLAQSIGHRVRTINALHQLARVQYALGERALCKQYLSECLELAQAVEHPHLMNENLMYWGELYLNDGHVAAALVAFWLALVVASEARAFGFCAEPLDGLAQCASAGGNLAQILLCLRAWVRHYPLDVGYVARNGAYRASAAE